MAAAGAPQIIFARLSETTATSTLSAASFSVKKEPATIRSPQIFA